MNRKYAAALLAVATLAVLIQNVIFFRSVPQIWDESIDLDGADPDDDVAVELAPIDAAALSSFLMGLPAPQGERSPFLSRLEAESLRVRVSTLGGDDGGEQAPRLDGILWSPARRVAWLDGRPHSEGDFVRGGFVEHIAERSVTLRAGDSQLQLTLESAELRGTAAPDSELSREVEEHDQ